jgi:hypothetical protein
MSTIVKGEMFGALSLKAPYEKAFAMFEEDFQVFKMDAGARSKSYKACCFCKR